MYQGDPGKRVHPGSGHFGVKGSGAIIDFSLLGVRELHGTLENLALPLLMVGGGALEILFFPLFYE